MADDEVTLGEQFLSALALAVAGSESHKQILDALRARVANMHAELSADEFQRLFEIVNFFAKTVQQQRDRIEAASDIDEMFDRLIDKL